MQGRYGASVVDEDGYILKLSRYVHLNPVFTKVHESKTVSERIRLLRDYPWSSYPSYIGRSKRLGYVDYAPILEMIEHSQRKQAGTYRRFVESGIGNIDAAFIADKRRSCLCIGSDESHARVKELYNERVNEYISREDVSFRCEADTIPVKDALNAVSRVLRIPIVELKRRSYKSYARPLAAKILCQHCGLSQREVAVLLGMRTGAGVCQQLRRLDGKIRNDRYLQTVLQRIEDEFQSVRR
jgi:hypothetical protein